MPAEQPLSVTDLLTAVDALCQAYAHANRLKALAEYADTAEERQHRLSNAQYWMGETNTRYQHLIVAMRASVPEPATVEAFRPVRPLDNGQVEVHALDRDARPVVLRLTGAHALAIGAHLTAYAAIGIDRAGQKVEPALPDLPATGPAAQITETPADPAAANPHVA